MSKVPSPAPPEEVAGEHGGGEDEQRPEQGSRQDDAEGERGHG